MCLNGIAAQVLNSRVAILGGRETQDSILLSDFVVANTEYPSIHVPHESSLEQTTLRVEISKVMDATDTEYTPSSQSESAEQKCSPLSV